MQPQDASKAFSVQYLVKGRLTYFLGWRWLIAYLRTSGTSTSVTHAKLSSVPHNLRLSLFRFILLPPLDLRLRNRSGGFPTAILCSNSIILTWRKKTSCKVPFTMGSGFSNQITMPVWERSIILDTLVLKLHDLSYVWNVTRQVLFETNLSPPTQLLLKTTSSILREFLRRHHMLYSFSSRLRVIRRWKLKLWSVTRVLAALVCLVAIDNFFLILSPSSSFICAFHQWYMKILELSSGCASYLPCFLDSSWLGLTESREFPHTNRDYMWWVLSNSQWTKSFPILSPPRWTGNLKCGSTPWLLLEFWVQGSF